jgi:hypothetical protein
LVIEDFPLGTAEIPSNGVDEVANFTRNFRDTAAVFDDEAHLAGLDERFEANFLILGFASRRWLGAGTDDERQRLNRELSLQRASSVQSALQTGLPDGTFRFESRGLGGTVSASMGGQQTLVPEQGDGKQLEELIRRREKDLESERPDLSAQERHAQALRELGPRADSEPVRAVRVLAVWTMPLIDWSRPSIPEEKVPPVCGGDEPLWREFPKKAPKQEESPKESPPPEPDKPPEGPDVA